MIIKKSREEIYSNNYSVVEIPEMNNDNKSVLETLYSIYNNKNQNREK